MNKKIEEITDLSVTDVEIQPYLLRIMCTRELWRQQTKFVPVRRYIRGSDNRRVFKMLQPRVLETFTAFILQSVLSILRGDVIEIVESYDPFYTAHLPQLINDSIY